MSLATWILPALAGPISQQPVVAFIPSFSPMEIMVILVIALLLFGKRLPEVMRSMGRGVVEFKKGIRGVEDEVNAEQQKPNKLPPTPPA